MTTFEIVVIVVGALGIAAACTRYFHTRHVLADDRLRGPSWIDHPEDHEPGERPSGDERDAPLPLRPLRGSPKAR
jgi:hypothetical protein